MRSMNKKGLSRNFLSRQSQEIMLFEFYVEAIECIRCVFDNKDAILADSYASVCANYFYIKFWVRNRISYLIISSAGCKHRKTCSKRDFAS